MGALRTDDAPRYVELYRRSIHEARTLWLEQAQRLDWVGFGVRRREPMRDRWASPPIAVPLLTA